MAEHNGWAGVICAAAAPPGNQPLGIALPWLASAAAWGAVRDTAEDPDGWDAPADPAWRAALDAEYVVQADLLRCIFVPFSPATFDPSWRSETAVALARQMYENRDFLLMGVLSDALQDAGCPDGDLLNHCRSQGVHTRGCFVVDLVLNRA
jgi:hypothetical protein